MNSIDEAIKKMEDCTDAKDMTYGEMLSPAMLVDTEEQASKYLGVMIDFYVRLNGLSEVEAKKACLSNIGYFAGYGNQSTAEKVWRLFKAAHPIFGTNYPTPEEAFKAGQDVAKAE